MQWLLTAREIEGIIPHRYPFLLVDGISELIPGNWAVGYKKVSAGEFFLQNMPGGKQILPRALVLEAMAQVGAVAVLSQTLYRGKSTLLAGINGAALMRDVVLGDEIRLEAEVMKIKGNIPHRIVLEARKNGLIIRPLGNVMILMPILSMTLPELKDVLDITYGAFKKVTEEEARC